MNLPGLASSDETKQTCQAPKLVVMWIFCICALSEQNAKATQIVQFSHIPYISQDMFSNSLSNTFVFLIVLNLLRLETD